MAVPCFPLWTPETYKGTTITLASAYAGGRAGGGQGGKGLTQNQMYKNALQPYNNGPLTNAGRALTKHPNIAGAKDINALNKMFQNSTQKNKAAAEAIKNIMRNGSKSIKNTKAFGEVVDYELPNGLGVRYGNTTNEFIGFLGRGQ